MNISIIRRNYDDDGSYYDIELVDRNEVFSFDLNEDEFETLIAELQEFYLLYSQSEDEEEYTNINFEREQ